jgi:hypothetical protein
MRREEPRPRTEEEEDGSDRSPTLEHRRAWGKQAEIAPDGDEEEKVGDGRGRGEGRRRGRKVEAESALVRHPRPWLWRSVTSVCGREEEAESGNRQTSRSSLASGPSHRRSARRKTRWRMSHSRRGSIRSAGCWRSGRRGSSAEGFAGDAAGGSDGSNDEIVGWNQGGGG